MIVLVNKKRFAAVFSFLLIGIILIVGLLNINRMWQRAYPLKYSDYVEKYADEMGIDKYLVYAVIKAESNFDEKAVSEKGAVGLMQIMPETGREGAKKLGIKDYSDKKLTDPKINIHIGCYYISFLMNRYGGDIRTAMAAYNAGYGNVDNWLAREQKNVIEEGNIPFGETKKYIVKILNGYEKYKEIYDEGDK